MVHYDGMRWSRIETGRSEDLWGIFGFSPDDLWIVGGDPFDGDPIVLHYDGAIFEAETIAASDNPGGAHALFKVWGASGTLFAVGQKGLILGRSSDSWTTMSAGALADQDFVSLWGTGPDHVVAVGGRQNARIATFDGADWQTRAPDALAGLNGVHLSSEDLAVIGGVRGFLGRFEPSTGEVVREAEGLTELDVHAVWGDGAGRHIAVGGTFAEPHRGVALIRESDIAPPR
jgi:hypothetical protein